MERSSVKSFIDQMFDSIPHDTFLPSIVQSVSDSLKGIFYKDTPYWLPAQQDRFNFDLEFRKYNKYGQTVYLCFKFNGQRWDDTRARSLTISLIDEGLRPIGNGEILEFVDVWKNQEIFYRAFLSLVTEGLRLTEIDSEG